MDANLSKRIDKLVEDSFEKVMSLTKQIDRKAAANGAYDSGGRLLERNEAVISAFRDLTIELARIVSARGIVGAERVSAVDEGAKRLVNRIVQHQLQEVEALGSRTSPGSRTPSLAKKMLTELEQKLNEDAETVASDLEHGWTWGQQIAPDPVVRPNVTFGPNYGNQQVGVGDHVNQSMVVNPALSDLVGLIDHILASKEFAALGENQRRDLEEAAEDIKEEAARPSPDQSRIQRWGERFIHRLKAAGLIVAEEFMKAALMVGLTALAGAAPAL